MRLGVDVGGTFTDAALHDGTRLWTAKVPTTPDDQSHGVLAAVDAVLQRAEARADEIEEFSHGMTVGTNALLEESGARTALIATEGFTDVIEIGRQDRPALYRPCAPKPAPLVPAERRIGAPERMGSKGPITPLAPAAIDELEAAVVEADAEAVAVCLLFAYAHPEHEIAIAEALRDRLPGVHVSTSHEVLPRFREFERFSTTVIDAYLSPLLTRYLSSLADAAATRGLPSPRIMRSSGGVAEVAEAARSGAWSVLSGPAGGAVGAALLARLSAGGNAVGLDMGGTSCDVCVVEDGRVRKTDARQISGRPIQLPMVDVHTVGAGGGSVGWRDRGGALRVGPRSAGSQPGPACYGRGGTEPTVTDANLALGRLAAGSPLAGGVELDTGRSAAALETLGRELGLDPLETAAGIVRIANQEMVRALRVVTVERGIDPREFALMPFGGAGPLHAAEVAEELGIRRIACPRAGGVLSALGLVASERRRDIARTVMLRGAELTASRIAEEVSALADAAAEGLPASAVSCEFALRYCGQAFELTVPGPEQPDPADLVEAFEAAHEERYGYRDEEADVELVDVLVAATIPAEDPELQADVPGAEESMRQVHLGGGWTEARILRGEPETGLTASGPVVFELPEATLVLPPGWDAQVDEVGTILAERAV